MRVFILLLLLFLLSNACHKEVNHSHPKSTITQGCVQEILPYKLETDCKHVCWGDTFKIKFIGQKRVYDSIKISRTRGIMQKTDIDSIYIIAIPTQDIAFLPSEVTKKQEVAINARIKRKNTETYKDYTTSVYFNVSKEP